MSKVKLEDIVSLAKRRGFIYPSSDIYGGMAGVYDYGPLGIRLKRNIEDIWLKFFVDGWDDMYQVDAGILMNKKVWEASGHAAGFNDPMVECSNCKSRLRADHVEKDQCPVCGAAHTLSAPREFNMMFKTQVGAVENEESTSYLRPETAQGIFVNFKNVLDSFYPDMPFGIAQIGKAFRNEISPREFLFRLREMEQMEIEYFVPEADWEKYFEKWRKDTHAFFKKLGLPADKIHELEVPEADRAHYSKRTIDFEFDFPFGKRELSGLAYRTDYDLKAHQEASGKSMEYRLKNPPAGGGGEAFIPHVIEPSFGVDRLVLAVLTAAYSEDDPPAGGEGEKRIVMKFAPEVAPVKVAVCPLAKNKPELVKKAREVYEMLKNPPANMPELRSLKGGVVWVDTGNIGKNYRRADEIGVPKFITVDFESLENDDVTIRDRDTTKQVRVKISDLKSAVTGSKDE